jgi:hypothetical protein
MISIFSFQHAWNFDCLFRRGHWCGAHTAGRCLPLLVPRQPDPEGGAVRLALHDVTSAAA